MPWGECAQHSIFGMRKTRKVVLYGNSLGLSAIESCLSARPGLKLMRVETGLPGSVERLARLAPNTVIFDVHSVPFDFGFEFLHSHPGISVIGFDLTNARIIRISTEESTVFTTDDLVRLI